MDSIIYISISFVFQSSRLQLNHSDAPKSADGFKDNKNIPDKPLEAKDPASATKYQYWK